MADAEEELLRSRIRNTQNNIIGQHEFSEFVNSDPEQIRFEEIEDEMLADIQRAVADANYGVEILAMGIKQLKVNENTSTAVFARMSSERQRRAASITNAGKAEDVRIRTDANSISDELEAAADARAKIIRGQGEAKAAQYYEDLEGNSELAMFLRDLEALPTTFVLGDFTLAHGSPREPVWEYILDPLIAALNFPHYQTPYCLI